MRCELLERRHLLAAAFLDISGPDLDGSSREVGFEDQIAIDEFNWSFSRQRGKPSDGSAFVSEFTFIKSFDGASAALATDAVLGQQHDSAKLSLTTDFGVGLGSSAVAEIELDDASITRYFNNDSDATASREQFDVAFEGIQFTSNGLNPQTGQPTGKLEASWDLPADVVDPVSLKGENDANAQLFLTIGGEQIALDTFAWGASQALSVGTKEITSLGAQAGEFSFSRGFDLATPGLFSLAANAKTAPTDIMLTYGSKNQVSTQWMLHDAEFTSFGISGKTGAADFQNDFSVSFSELEVEHFRRKDGDSKILGTTSANWDFTNSTPVVTSSGKFGNRPSDDGKAELVFVPIVGFGPDIAMQIDSFSWGALNPDRHGFVTGNPVDDLQFASLSLSASLDQSSPGLIAALADGTRIDDLELVHFQGIGEQGRLYERWDLTDVFVSSYSVSGTDSLNVSPTVTFTLDFAELKRTFPRLTDGKQRDVTLDQISDTSSGTSPDPVELMVSDGLKVTIDGVGDLTPSTVSWNVLDTGGKAAESGDFGIVAEHGPNSAALIKQLGDGQSIPTVTIERFENSGLAYRWELTDVFVTGYGTSTNSVLSAALTESFTLSPRMINLTANDLDKTGKVTGTRTLQWDLKTNVLDHSNSLFGDDVSDQVPGQTLTFPDGSEIQLDALAWSAALPLRPIQSDGTRTPSQPITSELEFAASRTPSPRLIASLIEGRDFLGDLDYDHSLISTQPGTSPVTLFSGQFGELSSLSRYGFVDDVIEAKRQNSFSIDSMEVEFAYNGIDPQLGLDGSDTSVSWDISTSKVTITGGFGSQRFGKAGLPQHVLEIGTGSKAVEFEVVSHSWGTRNPLGMVVGGPSPARQVPVLTDFQVTLPLNEATSGLLANLARGDTIDELAVVSRRDPTNNDRTPESEFRRWSLNDSFVTSYRIIPGGTIDPPSIVVSFNPGRIRSENQVFNNKGEIVSSQTDFLDFTTPPRSLGLTNVQTTSGSENLDVRLPDLFEDERQSSDQLAYTVTVEDIVAPNAAVQSSVARSTKTVANSVASDVANNSVLFDNVQLVDGVLVLDYAEDQSGTASVSVTATDVFGLQVTDSFLVDVIEPLDFGDAPALYPTTIADGGASHRITGPRLGNAREMEDDGNPSPAALGDDTVGVDDEDGVLFGGLSAGNQAGINIDLQNAASAQVDAWIDFNQDGVWDSSEKILGNVTVNAGLQTINYSVPAGADPGVTFARVRVSTAGNLAPTGPANDGEVEDYAITIGTRVATPTATINAGRSTRSELTSIEVTFDSAVNAVASDFVLTDQDDQVIPGIAVASSGNVSTITFTSGPGVITGDHAGVPPTLANGDYQLFYRPNLPENTRGLTIGSGSEIEIDDFFRKYGDTDGDESTNVGLTDFAAFRGAFGSRVGEDAFDTGLDANRDGTIGLTDFAAFRSGFGQ